MVATLLVATLLVAAGRYAVVPDLMTECPAPPRSGNEKTLALPEEGKREGTDIRWAILESNQ